MGPGSISAFTRVFDTLWAGTTAYECSSYATKALKRPPAAPHFPNVNTSW